MKYVLLLLAAVASCHCADFLLHSREGEEDYIDPVSQEAEAIASMEDVLEQKMDEQNKLIRGLAEEIKQLKNTGDQMTDKDGLRQVLSSITNQQKLLMTKMDNMQQQISNLPAADKNSTSDDVTHNDGSFYDSVDIYEPQSYTGPCEPGWFHSPKTGSCYFIDTHQVSWNVANKRCQQRGSHLVAIETAKELKALEELTKKEGMCHVGVYWTGGREEDCQWSWAMGDQEEDKPMTYQPWLPNEPNNVGMGEDHVTIKFPSNGKSGFNDLNLSYSVRFICEKKAWANKK